MRKLNKVARLILHTEQMVAKHIKTHLIKILNFVEDSSIDLDSEDCAIFLDEYNIKIVSYHDGYLAYHGVRIGNGGHGASRVSALKHLLESFNINHSDLESLEASMRLIFKA